MFSFIKTHASIISLIGTVLAVLTILGFIYWAGGQVESNKAKIAQLENDLAASKQAFESFKDNVITVDNISEYANKHTHTQQIIRERIQNVEVKGDDRPYRDDPGMLERARIMRDYQHTYKTGGLNLPE